MRLIHPIFLAFFLFAMTLSADPVGTLAFSKMLAAEPVGDLPLGYRVIETSGDFALDAAGNLYTTLQRRICHGPGAGTCEYFLFIFKFTPDGEVLYSTLLPDPDRASGATAIAVDAEGNVYITGQTESASLPTTPGTLQPQPPPGQNGYVCKLDAAGQVLFCTYLGGSGYDSPFGIDVDAAGGVYIGGRTDSRDFPTTSGSFSPQPPESTRADDPNAFVAKLSADGSQLIFSTYLGGSEGDLVNALDVDGQGAVYIAGSGGDDFPVTLGAFRTEPDSTFAARLSADGSTLLYSTFLGSGLVDAIAADPDGNLWLAGVAWGDDSGPDNYPTTPDAAGSWGGGFSDAFVSKLDPTGSRLLYSSFFGGFTREGVNDLTLDREGNVYVTGSTSASTFPRTGDAEQSCLHGALIANDAYYFKLDSAGRLLHSSFLGGLNRDLATAIGVSPGGAIYLVGITQSPDFSVTGDPVKFDEIGSERAFIAKVEPGEPAVSISCVVNAASQLNEPATAGGMLTFYGRGLENAEVFFDGIPAPILYSGDRQLNLVVPFGIRGMPLVKAEVITPKGRARPMHFVVREVAPALFTIDGSGNGQVAAINQDGTVNSPAYPAPRGSIVALYATGLGPLTPPPADGEILTRAPFPLAGKAFQVGFYKYPIHGEITYSGAAPGFIAGAYQVNVRIPEEAPTGSDVPIWLWFTEDDVFSLAIPIAIE